MAASDKQNTRLNDEPLLLQSVRMHRPAGGARGGIDVHSSHLVSGIVIAPDPHSESFDLDAGRHDENLTNPPRNCEVHEIRTAHSYRDGCGSCQGCGSRDRPTGRPGTGAAQDAVTEREYPFR
jgi:hypothetical protein